MNRMVASSLSVCALAGGVAALASGLAAISLSTFGSWAHLDTGLALVLAGLASWIVGVCMVKGADRTNNKR
jgi:tellurite resistance protein TehA-like permease